jgi:hypothetical protein
MPSNLVPDAGEGGGLFPCQRWVMSVMLALKKFFFRWLMLAVSWQYLCLSRVRKFNGLRGLPDAPAAGLNPHPRSVP